MSQYIHLAEELMADINLLCVVFQLINRQWNMRVFPLSSSSQWESQATWDDILAARPTVLLSETPG
ncbi:hypothetical protein Csa_017616 [Cucumis sativus]|uniref:Uncharacterized protein n=1 Tax=Cucumis sativus TaxID=3659 RepID=A0A0A0L8A5_CUCSA|nr:hypothetical protein Csa_017616 [Cucumis sativus]